MRDVNEIEQELEKQTLLFQELHSPVLPEFFQLVLGKLLFHQLVLQSQDWLSKKLLILHF